MKLGWFGRENKIVVEGDLPPWGSAVAIDDRYFSMVKQLELRAAAAPDTYRRRVVLAAWLGYGVILGISTLLVGLSVGLVLFMIGSGHVNALELKVLLVLGLLSWSILRSLIVRIEPPEGRRVSAGEAPRLFELVEDLRARIGGPTIDEVLVTADFNAAIIQQPRLGPFGWNRNYLILGLPLMQALSEKELAAVIGHELGHFAGEHGRLATSIYRARTVWMQLSARLDAGFFAGLLRRFFRWYGPWFNAYSFVLARSQEYEADRVAASSTSAATIGAALIRLELRAELFDKHWQRFYEAAAVHAEPPHMPFSSARQLFSLADQSPPPAASLQAALRRRTGLEDTHPSLADRLQALGVAPNEPSAVAATAASAVLGPLEDLLATELDQGWWAQNEDWWREYHVQRRADLAELAQLEAQSEAGDLDRAARLRRAELVSDLRGEEEALPLYEAMIAENPGDCDAAFLAGMLRLKQDDRTGVELLLKAAESDSMLASSAYCLLLEHYQHEADDTAIEEIRERLACAEEWDRRADEEWRTLTRDSRFEPPDYTAEQETHLRQAAAELGLKTLQVGVRVLPLSYRRQQVAVFECIEASNASAAADSIVKLLSAFGDIICVGASSDTKWLRKRLNGLEGSCIYRHA